jgi:hypothetical protein
MSEISHRQAAEIQQVLDRDTSFKPVEMHLMAQRIRKEGLTPDTVKETQKLLDRGTQYLNQHLVTSHEMALIDSYCERLKECIQDSDKHALENPKTAIANLDEGLNTFGYAMRDAFQRSDVLAPYMKGVSN